MKKLLLFFAVLLLCCGISHAAGCIDGPPGPICLTAASPTGSNSGYSQSFTVTFSGATTFDKWVNVTIAPIGFKFGSSTANICLASFNWQTKAWGLANDAGTAILSMSNGHVHNSQCEVSQGGSVYSTTSSSLTVTFSISFNAGWSGTWGVYSFANNIYGQNTPLFQFGTWAVPPISIGEITALVGNPPLYVQPSVDNFGHGGTGFTDLPANWQGTQTQYMIPEYPFLAHACDYTCGSNGCVQHKNTPMLYLWGRPAPQSGYHAHENPSGDSNREPLGLSMVYNNAPQTNPSRNYDQNGCAILQFSPLLYSGDFWMRTEPTDPVLFAEWTPTTNSDVYFTVGLDPASAQSFSYFTGGPGISWNWWNNSSLTVNSHDREQNYLYRPLWDVLFEFGQAYADCMFPTIGNIADNPDHQFQLIRAALPSIGGLDDYPDHDVSGPGLSYWQSSNPDPHIYGDEVDFYNPSTFDDPNVPACIVKARSGLPLNGGPASWGPAYPAGALPFWHLKYTGQ